MNSKSDDDDWEDDHEHYPYPWSHTMEVDDVHFVQPVGFVWFQKPRYRVKAISRWVGDPPDLDDDYYDDDECDDDEDIES